MTDARAMTFADDARVLGRDGVDEAHFGAPETAVVTPASLAADLRAFGIKRGDIVCLHVSMKSLGLVVGGPRTIIGGMLDVLWPNGTLMMAAYSGDMSDPAEWRHPPVPAHLVEKVCAEMPGYDPATTPTRRVGAVAEYFRTYPDVVRSPHPQSSFLALGYRAKALVGEHPLDFRFGWKSPLGALVRLKGRVLMMGAPDDTASLFHLMRFNQATHPIIEKRAPVLVNDRTEWRAYRDVDYPIDWFDAGMAYLRAQGIARDGRIGGARCTIFDAEPAAVAITAWQAGIR